MARRNPMNARYQKNTAPSGKTRKSAAAAKPSRAKGASAKSGTPAKGKGSASAKPSAFMAVDTPEFRYWRRIWWISVLAALVLTAVSFALLSIWKLQTASNIVLGLAYFAIFTSLYLDWFKIRPMRKDAYQAAKSGKAPKSADKPAEKPAEKPAKSEPDSTGADSADDTAEKPDTEGKA